jgi:hypothetical protein
MDGNKRTIINVRCMEHNTVVTFDGNAFMNLVAWIRAGCPASGKSGPGYACKTCSSDAKTAGLTAGRAEYAANCEDRRDAVLDEFKQNPRFAVHGHYESRPFGTQGRSQIELVDAKCTGGHSFARIRRQTLNDIGPLNFICPSCEADSFDSSWEQRVFDAVRDRLAKTHPGVSIRSIYSTKVKCTSFNPRSHYDAVVVTLSDGRKLLIEVQGYKTHWQSLAKQKMDRDKATFALTRDGFSAVLWMPFAAFQAKKAEQPARFEKFITFICAFINGASTAAMKSKCAADVELSPSVVFAGDSVDSKHHEWLEHWHADRDESMDDDCLVAE